MYVFRVPDGHEFTPGELRAVVASTRYEMSTGPDVPDRAKQLHQEGRALGGASRYKDAIERFAEASEIAPNWPYPLYDRAFTHLILKDDAKARFYYGKTVQLAPDGFLTALTALDTLGREEKGEFPKGTYLEYVRLEWERDPKKKRDKLRKLVKRSPRFAPAWNELVKLAETLQERLEGIEKGLAANPDPETLGTLKMQEAFERAAQGDGEGGRKLLIELAHSPDVSKRTRMFAEKFSEFFVEK